MSRRRPRAEIQFGSDSFLDVVANIVGILIILIVIAGLRVSRTPVVQMPTIKPEDIETEQVVIPTSSLPPLAEAIEGAPETSRIVILEPADEQDEITTADSPPLPPLAAPPDLVDLANQLEAEISAMQAENAGMKEKLKLTNEQQSALLEKQRSIQSKLADKAQEVAASQKKAAIVVADLDLAKQTLARLAKQVNEIESIPTHVETLQHKITPISRVVSGKEKHFRLENNQIAEVPIEDLIENLRDQIDRRKDWLVKMRQHQGTIGPIRGFNMTYSVRVESASDMDFGRSSQGGYRISLSNWEIHPEPEMSGETEEVALRRGSHFYQSILGTSPDTTLTFWVYPDSYPLYRRLQKFTHQHGFSVAARPLPKGVPIAGSPNGSRSASQ